MFFCQNYLLIMANTHIELYVLVQKITNPLFEYDFFYLDTYCKIETLSTCLFLLTYIVIVIKYFFSHNFPAMYVVTMLVSVLPFIFPSVSRNISVLVHVD